MSPDALERALRDAKRRGRLPKAVIAVNLYGQSAKMDELMSLCDAYGVCLIEDAAESLGSTYKGRQSGTFGRFGIYSFNGNKIITTSGGGMLVSDDEAAIEKRGFLRHRREMPPFITSTASSGITTGSATFSRAWGYRSWKCLKIASGRGEKSFTGIGKRWKRIRASA